MWVKAISCQKGTVHDPRGEKNTFGTKYPAKRPLIQPVISSKLLYCGGCRPPCSLRDSENLNYPEANLSRLRFSFFKIFATRAKN